MRVVEGRSGSRLRVWIGVLVTVLMVAAFTPAVLSRSTMSAKSQTIPAGVSSKAVVLAGAGHFAPPHSDSGYDANGNGLFDFLLVNASVQITAPGNFTVSGTLHDANNTLQIYNLTSAGLPTGPANLTIWFDGRPINQSGIDGPYTVDLILFNENFSLLDIGTHTTQPYSHLDFDPVPAFMTPPHPDSGQDTNANGLFDLLNVDVQVQVNLPANYTASAFLHDASFTLTPFTLAAALPTCHVLAPRYQHTDDATLQPPRFRSDTRLHDAASFRFRPRHERKWPLRRPERRRPSPRESSGQLHRERILARCELHAHRVRLRVGIPTDWTGIHSGIVPRRSDQSIGSRWSVYRRTAALTGRVVLGPRDEYHDDAGVQPSCLRWAHSCHPDSIVPRRDNPHD